MFQVFIDGSAGTTGLRIRQRLEGRSDVQLILLPEERRKDPQARAEAMGKADAVFLCLPDDAAREAVALAKDVSGVIIDTSTAHRTHPAWTYGFPELAEAREKISSSRRIANPGCHATGFIALVAPLVRGGILRSDTALTCFSLTGYSGGGKKMIGEYEASTDGSLIAPRMYGLTQTHKHLPEMAAVTGLSVAPVFCPVVSSYYAGMEVTVPLFADQAAGGAEAIRECYKSYYRSGAVRYAEGNDENGFLSAGAFAGRDDLEVSVFGNEGRILLVARFDNLGKGASGAAIQNMNLALGAEETAGLNLGGNAT